jgi:hypothetical protein
MLGPRVESGNMPVVQRRTQVLGAGEVKHLLDEVRHFPKDRTNGIGSDLGAAAVGVKSASSLVRARRTATIGPLVRASVIARITPRRHISCRKKARWK